MKSFTLISFVAICLTAVSSKRLLFKPEGKSSNEGVHWVLLAAGSKGWHNYRHQADISHAYQIARKHGIPAERIVTMMFDDIATSPENPFPGKIFNRPGGPDVYEGVVVDYRGKDVTSENFLAVLRGDEKAMAGKGSGKVIKSGPNDHVFVNFVDHGGHGVLVFPSDHLTARKLMNTINDMHENKRYGQMVMYIEACHSGSMFEILLPEDINVYATTAASSRQSSHACNFDEKINTYLGDLYSVNWMEDSDEGKLNLETLHEQYLVVKNKTDRSDVCEFGDKKISEETLDNFQGETDFYVAKPPKSKKQRNMNDAVPSEDVPLAILRNQLSRVDDEEKRNEIIGEINQLNLEKNLIEETSREIVRKVSAATNNHFASLYYANHKLKSHDCYEEAVRLYKEHCFDITRNGYALKSLSKLVNLCEARVPMWLITSAIKETCSF